MAIADLKNDEIKKLEASNAPPKVVEAYKILSRFKNASARKTWIDRRAECWRAAIDNEFFTEEEQKEMADMKQPPVPVNRLNKGVQGSAAIVTDSKPEIKFNPLGSGDLYVAEVLKRGHDTVWRKNEGSDVIYAGVEEKNIGGVAFWDVRHDPSKGMYGRLTFEEADPTIFYWDPDSRARDFSDSHLIKAQLRTKSYIKDHYDGIKDADLNFQRELQDEEDGDTTDTKTGGDNYAEDPKTDPDATPGDEEEKNVWEMEAWLLKTVKEDWVIYQLAETPEPQTAQLDLAKGQKPEEAIEEWQKDLLLKGIRFARDENDQDIITHWPRKLQKRYFRIIVGKKLISQLDEDGEEVDEVVNPHGEDADGDPVLPIIGLKAQRTQNSYCTSPTWYAMPINKALCKRESQFIYAASAALNAPIVRDDSAKWQGKKGVPGSELIISKNTAIKPYRLSPENVPLQNLTFLIQENKNDIDDQYDLKAVMKGEVPEGQEKMSGRLALALQDYGSMMSKPSLRALESAMVRLAKVDIAIMLKTWPRHMWERLLEKEELTTLSMDEQEQQRINNPDEDTEELEQEVSSRWVEAIEKIRPADPTKPAGIGLIDLDVSMSAGSSLPTNRMAKHGVALEAYEAGLYDRQAALEYSDDPKAKEIAERMAKAEEAAAQDELLKRGR